jgi:hypothetical protein
MVTDQTDVKTSIFHRIQNSVDSEKQVIVIDQCSPVLNLSLKAEGQIMVAGSETGSAPPPCLEMAATIELNMRVEEKGMRLELELLCNFEKHYDSKVKFSNSLLTLCDQENASPSTRGAMMRIDSDNIKIFIKVAEPADKNFTVVKFCSVPVTQNNYNNETSFYLNGVNMPLVMTSSVSGYVTSLGFDSDLLFRVSSRWQVSWRTIRAPLGSAVMISFPKIHSLYYQG